MGHYVNFLLTGLVGQGYLDSKRWSWLLPIPSIGCGGRLSVTIPFTRGEVGIVSLRGVKSRVSRESNLQVERASSPSIRMTGKMPAPPKMRLLPLLSSGVAMTVFRRS